MDKSDHATLKKSLDRLEVDLIRFKQILKMESETARNSKPSSPNSLKEPLSSPADGKTAATATTAAVIRRRHGTGSTIRYVRVQYARFHHAARTHACCTFEYAYKVGRFVLLLYKHGTEAYCLIIFLCSAFAIVLSVLSAFL